MDRQSETEREARLRAVQAMQDDLYKRTADSRGEMLRASRRNYTDTPERGMSADGQAAASDARMLAGDLVRGSSSGAREMLGVTPPAAAKRVTPREVSADMMGSVGIETPEQARAAANRERIIRAVHQSAGGGAMSADEYERARQRLSSPAAADPVAKFAPGGPSGKSGKGADMSREARNMRGRQASADAAYKRRAMGRTMDRRDIAEDIQERRDAGLLSDEATRRALESLMTRDSAGTMRSREDVINDIDERREAGMLDEEEARRIREAMAR